MAFRDNPCASPDCPADLEAFPLDDGRSALEKVLPPKAEGSRLRISLEDVLRFFLAAARTFFADTFRLFDCLAVALILDFPDEFFLFGFAFALLLLRICARCLFSAMRKM
jgi:hypothetical protein